MPLRAPQAIVDFETGDRPGAAGRAIESRDATKTYNKMTRRRSRASGAGLRLRDLSSTGSARRSTRVIVAQPSAVTGIAKLVADDAARACCKDQLLAPLARRLCRRAARARSTTRTSPSTAPSCRARPSRKPRWKRGVRLHHRRARRRGQQDLCRANISRPRPRRRPTQLVKNIIAAMDARHRQARLDGARDQGQGACQARRLHAQDRLSRPVARLFGAEDRRAATRSATNRAPTSGSTTITSHKLGKPLQRWEWGMTPMDGERLCQFRHGRDRLPGRDPAAALLRSQCRSGGQLWRHRRGDRPRAQPPFRRSGLEIRRARPADRLVDAAGRRRASRRCTDELVDAI